MSPNRSHFTHWIVEAKDTFRHIKTFRGLLKTPINGSSCSKTFTLIHIILSLYHSRENQSVKTNKGSLLCLHDCAWIPLNVTIYVFIAHDAAADLQCHTPPAPVEPPTLPEVAELRLGPTLLLAHRAVAGEWDVSANPAVLRGSVGATGSHDLLARQAPVGWAQALLVGAHAAAVAESPCQDVLRTDAAVGGLVEQVGVVPAVLALAKEILHVRFAFGALGAAPQRDDDRDHDGKRGPEEQRPLLPGAAVALRIVSLFAHRFWADDANGRKSENSGAPSTTLRADGAFARRHSCLQTPELKNKHGDV